MSFQSGGPPFPHRLLRHFMGEIDCQLLPLHVDFVLTFACRYTSTYVDLCQFLSISASYVVSWSTCVRILDSLLYDSAVLLGGPQLSRRVGGPNVLGGPVHAIFIHYYKSHTQKQPLPTHRAGITIFDWSNNFQKFKNYEKKLITSIGILYLLSTYQKQKAIFINIPLPTEQPLTFLNSQKHVMLDNVNKPVHD